MNISATSRLGLLITIASLFVIIRHTCAAVITIPTSDRTSRGWYLDNGFHSSTESYADNYFVGSDNEEYRNFFIFPLPALSPGESISSVSLVLHCPSVHPEFGYPRGYDSPDSTETFQLFALDTTSIAALRAGGLGLTGIFADLGDGIPYSTGIVLSPASQGSDVIISLSAAFLAYANANLGSEISLGGALTTLAPENINPTDSYVAEGVFGHTGGDLNQTRLIINTVPEPSSAALLLSGGLFCMRRRSLRTNDRNA